MYHTYDELNVLVEAGFVAFLNEKLTKPLDEGRSIKRLYLSNMWLFEYDARDRKKRGAEKAVGLGKRLVSPVLKQFEETGEQRSSIHVKNTG